MSRAKLNKLSTTESVAKKLKLSYAIVISCSINNSYVPCLWKHSQVTMLPKPQKKEKAENYRPISLTNCIAKSVKLLLKIHPRPL